MIEEHKSEHDNRSWVGVAAAFAIVAGLAVPYFLWGDDQSIKVDCDTQKTRLTEFFNDPLVREKLKFYAVGQGSVGMEAVYEKGKDEKLTGSTNGKNECEPVFVKRKLDLSHE